MYTSCPYVEAEDTEFARLQFNPFCLFKWKIVYGNEVLISSRKKNISMNFELAKKKLSKFPYITKIHEIK